MNQPLVTVGITAYNRSAVVGRAIESVLRQSFTDFEIVIVDDASRDNTREVISRYAAQDPRIRPIFMEKNRGVNGAKNALFDNARGEFTTFLDSDDELFPDALANFVDAFHELGPEFGMIFMNCEDPASHEWTGLGLTEDCEATYLDAICSRFSGQFTGMWKTKILGELRFAEHEAAREINVWFHIYRRTRVYYFHRCAQWYYRDTPGSVVAMRFDVETARRRLAATLSQLRMFGDDMKRANAPNLVALYREVLLYAGMAGDGQRAREAARELKSLVGSLRSSPFVLASWLPRSAFVWLARRYYAARRLKTA